MDILFKSIQAFRKIFLLNNECIELKFINLFYFYYKNLKIYENYNFFVMVLLPEDKTIFYCVYIIPFHLYVVKVFNKI